MSDVMLTMTAFNAATAPDRIERLARVEKVQP